MSDASGPTEDQQPRVHEGLTEYEQMRVGMLRTVLKWALWIVLAAIGLVLVAGSLARLLGIP